MTEFIFSSNPWLFPIVMLVVMGLSIELPYRLAKSLMASNLVKDAAWNTVQAGRGSSLADVVDRRRSDPVRHQYVFRPALL